MSTQNLPPNRLHFIRYIGENKLDVRGPKSKNIYTRIVAIINLNINHNSKVSDKLYTEIYHGSIWAKLLPIITGCRQGGAWGLKPPPPQIFQKM